MKFETTAKFDSDYANLKEEHRRLVREALPAFLTAAEDHVANPGRGWPAALRVKPMAHHPSVWEMTWHFKSPDGRATFEWIEIDGEPAVRRRRIGDHSIFENP